MTFSLLSPDARPQFHPTYPPHFLHPLHKMHRVNGLHPMHQKHLIPCMLHPMHNMHPLHYLHPLPDLPAFQMTCWTVPCRRWKSMLNPCLCASIGSPEALIQTLAMSVSASWQLHVISALERFRWVSLRLKCEVLSSA